MKELSLFFLKQLNTFSLLLLALIVFTILLSFHEKSLNEPPEEVGTCGVSSLPMDPLFSQGKVLFKQNCASCHNKDMKNLLTGPALKGAKERWADYPQEDLYNFIRNSQKMIHEQRHPKAVELWGKYGPSVMTSFPSLTDEEIDALFIYIEEI